MISLVISLLLTAGSIRFLMRRMPTCSPTQDRWNNNEKSTCAGLVFFPIFLFSIFFSQGRGSLVALALACGAIWFLGLVDDLNDLSAKLKFKAQLVIAIALVAFGWRLQWVDNIFLDSSLSLLWIVGLTNAFNLLDNMDGLAGGITAIASLFLIVITGSKMAFVLLGISLGFLVFNLPPAQIFMGDCGAYFFGLTLSCLSMNDEIGISAVPLLIVPIADTTFVTARRLWKKKSPARGGLDHLSHELAKIGRTPLALAVLWGAAILGGLITLALR